MNGRSPVVITLSLLGVMATITLISAIVGYKVGAIALEGVTQPEANPAKKFANGKYELDDPQSFKPLNEKTIIEQVYYTIQRKSEAFKPESVAKPETESDNAPDNSAPVATANPDVNPEPSPATTKLPLESTASDVVLSVNGMEQSGNSLVLAISLQNKGDRPRRFLYSFLEIKDDTGNAIGGITEGLPEEIPPNQQVFTGQIKIPRAIVQDGQTLTLTLSDYPQQSLTLSIPNIPITP
jgi:hypothetical protein